MVLNLTAAGENGEAMAAATGLVEAAETSQNPFAISFALLAYGFAYRDVKPLRAIDALRRGLAIAHDNGVRAMESFTAMTLGPLEVEHGDSMTALDYVTRTIRNYSDAGNTAVIRLPLACLATVLDRIGRYEAAATVGGQWTRNMHKLPGCHRTRPRRTPPDKPARARSPTTIPAVNIAIWGRC